MSGSCLKHMVGGVYPAKGQDSSVGGGAGDICLVVVHMEEEVQDRVQEESEGETHGKGQSEETTRNNQPLTMDDMNME